MTALAERLIAQIRASGPITLADYMAACLLHPEHGYYTRSEPFGQGGDFTTAPEISQMFGELAGLSLAQAWLDQGAPTPFCLAELGPGRGTLMADILRATRGVPGFHDALRLDLVEASAQLVAIQREALASYDMQAQWHGDIAALPEMPLFVVANEFFDALPIRQFQRDGAMWRERVVGVEGDSLRLGLSDPAPNPALDNRLADTKDGDVVELCPAAAAVMEETGRRIAAHGGAALIVDYGDWRSLGDTFQALRSHGYADPFVAPGSADLTAHVDFEALADAAPCRYTRVTPQGVFLERLGIAARAEALAAKLTGDALQSHIAAYRRLTHPDEMGTLFKVMGLYPETASPPPGLEA